MGDMQYQPSEHSVHLEQGMSQKILLQTARAKVSSPQNENTTANVRILLDSGAQRTYISYRPDIWSLLKFLEGNHSL